MKTFDLSIPKFKGTFGIDEKQIWITNIPVDTFFLPESLDCGDVAAILSKEDDSDLSDILECLKEELKKQNIKFTFTLKPGNYAHS
jgi:hypothetical protein